MNHRDYKIIESASQEKVEEKLKCLIGDFQNLLQFEREFVYITPRYIKIMIPIVPVLQKKR